MKKSFFIVLFLSIEFLVAQSVPKVENYPLKAMDVVIFPFGMEYPVTIGTISDSGELNFELPTDLRIIPEERKENFVISIASSLFSECDNSNDLYPEYENIKSAGGGYISLSSKENPYSGLFFMVTDESLVPWLENSYDNSAVVASYFELIYMYSDFNYQGTCTSILSETETDTMETVYSYNLQLKTGFNFIEYKIESVETHQVPTVYDENVFESIDKPSKITISSSQSTLPNTKWIGKYF